MPGPDRIEGYAIVSADGMIADASGVQPASLRIEADQKFFHAGVANADAAAHGRNSSEGGPQAASLRRLILTRKITGVAPDANNPNAVLWNPSGTPLVQAWRVLGLSGGTLAVIGGTDTFGHFLEHGYDVFHLTHAPRARLPGGRPVFPGMPARTPEDLLTSHGLTPSPARVLDEKSGATLVSWQRQPA